MGPSGNRGKKGETNNGIPKGRPAIMDIHEGKSNNPGFLQIQGLIRTGLIHHAFSTREGGVSKPPYDTLNLGLRVGDDHEAVRENRRRFFNALGIGPSQVVRVRQVHGSDVLVVDEALANKEGFPRILLDEGYKYDALITDQIGLALVITTADCFPIFILDPVRRAIGAIHAGWRSTVKRISQQALDKMIETFGTRAEDCLAAIGPGIGGCCYEVNSGVIEPLAAAFPNWRDLVTDKSPGRWNLNLGEANLRLLLEMGLKEENIFNPGLCTSCRRDLFYSHRRDRGRTGRMMNLIMLK